MPGHLAGKPVHVFSLQGRITVSPHECIIADPSMARYIIPGSLQFCLHSVHADQCTNLVSTIVCNIHPGIIKLVWLLRGSKKGSRAAGLVFCGVSQKALHLIYFA